MGIAQKSDLGGDGLQIQLLGEPELWLGPSNDRKGGSIKTAFSAPTISVAILERPLIDEEWWWGWRGVLLG